MALENGSFRKKRVKFAQVSNTALRDKSLSLKAKGLYSLIQSYITMVDVDEDFVLDKKSLFNICTEGEKAFENTWKELKDAGYLKQYKFRKVIQDGEEKINGFVYEYELLDEPNTEQPATTTYGLNGQVIVKVPEETSEIINSFVPPQKVGGTKGSGYKRGVSINNIIDNNIIYNNNNNISNISNLSIYPEEPEILEDEDRYDGYDYIDKTENLELTIRKNISASALEADFGKEIVENVVNVIVDAIENNQAEVRIGKDIIPKQKLQSRLMQLDMFKVQYVLKCLKELRTPIKRVDRYLLKSLYNADNTMKIYYQNLVNCTYYGDNNSG